MNTIMKFNTWVECVRFPSERYGGFKNIKIPYSEAHEKQARNSFFGGSSGTSKSICIRGGSLGKKCLTSEEIKKEHPEMFIPAKEWDKQRDEERRRLYNIEPKFYTDQELHPYFYGPVSAKRLEEVKKLREQCGWGGEYLKI